MPNYLKDKRKWPEINGGRVFVMLASMVCILTGVMIYLMPDAIDDRWYIAEGRYMPQGWDRFLCVLDKCLWHWQFDTGRLCNVVAAPFLALLPRWVYALLTAGMLGVMIFGGLRIAGARYMSLPSALWVLVISFAFPWFEYMYTVIYSINYVWGGALGIGLLLLFLNAGNDRHTAAQARQRLSPKVAALFLLAVITGWWHEGLSVPLICGVAAYLGVMRRRPTGAQIAVLAGLICGMIVYASLPALWQMVGNRNSYLISVSSAETFVKLVIFNCFFYVYAALLLIVICVKRLRHRVITDRRDLAFLMLILTFGLCATAINFRYNAGARSSIFPQLFCAIGLMWIFTRAGWQCRRGTATLLTCLALALSIISLAAAIPVQRRLAREWDHVAWHYDHSVRIGQDPTVFFDPTPISFGIDAMKPSYLALNSNTGMGEFNIIPTALRGFSLRDTSVVACSDSMLLIYNNHLVFKGSDDTPRLNLKITDGSGRTLTTRSFMRRFITADSDTVCAVIPVSQSVNRNLTLRDARRLP